jgi:surface protein
MFYDAPAFNQNISGWNTDKVTTMVSMFYDARTFNQNLSGWNVNVVTDHSFFNKGTSALQSSNCPIWKS